MKKISEEHYWHLSKNGARILFNWYDFRFLDCYNHDLEEELSHTIINFRDEGNLIFQVDMKSMYEFLTIYYHTPSHLLDEMISEKLEELITQGKSEKEK